MPRLVIDVETRSGTKTGLIASAFDLQYDEPLSQCGQFAFMMPGNDPRSALLGQKTSIVRMYLDNDPVFVGIVEGMKHSVDERGAPILEVYGRSRLAELAEATESGEYNNSNIAHSSILFNSAGPWTIDTVNGVSTLTYNLYAKLFRESILLVCVRIVELTGSQFIYKPTLSGADRKIIWLNSTGTASGIRAVAGVGDTVRAESNPNICFIQRLEKTVVSDHLYTIVAPYGSGQGDARLTLAASTTTQTGYSVNKGNNTITHDANFATYGSIGKAIQFKDITPISNTDADQQAAANALVRATIEWLARYSVPHNHYRLDVTHLAHTVLPGQTIRVVYVDDQYDIDQDLIILDVRTSVGSDGSVRKSLLVSDVDQMPTDSSNVVVSDLDQATIYMAHQQYNANAYTTGYRTPVDDTSTGDVWFFFGNEVAQIQQVLYRFKVNDLVSTVRSTGGESTTTEDGGAIAQSTVGGSAHAHNVPNHQHNTTIAGGGSFWGNMGLIAPSGGITFFKHDGDSNSYDVQTNAASGGTTSESESAHTHDITVAAHQHDVTASITATYGVFKDSSNRALLADLQWRINSSGGWTPFDANIITVSNPGGWLIEVTTDVDHNLSVGQTVYIANTTDYNGAYSVQAVPSSTTYRVTATYVSNQTGKSRTASDAVGGAGQFWQFDMTEFVYDSATFRPLQENNLLELRCVTADKTASIDGFLNVRSIIQSVAYTTF